MNTTHPVLIMIRGLPGSGKSYLTRALVESLGQANVVALDPDSTDYSSPEYLAHSEALAAEGVDQKFHPYRYIRGKAHKAIDENKILIWNQPFMSLDGFQKTVVNLTNYATEVGSELPMLLVEVEAPAKTAHERVIQRKEQGGHGPSHDTFNRFVSDYASFADQGYTIVTVQGHQDVTVSVEAVRKALDKLA